MNSSRGTTAKIKLTFQLLHFTTNQNEHQAKSN